MSPAVLIVDDSEFFRNALATALESDSAVAILKARNGREALQLLSDTPDVKAVVLSVGIPILNGKEVLKRLSRDRTASLFIVATGKAGDQEALQDCLSLGADEILTKPLDLESLSQRLHLQIGSTNANGP